MNIEIINTGSELLLGRVLNTHQQWLCRRLSDLGYEVSRQVCIADEAHAIQTAIREALCHADLIFVTGGLGPTADDITRDLIAQLLNRKLILDPSVLAQIQTYFDTRQRPLPPNAGVQAMVPEGAIVLPNSHGTAPGLAIELRPNPFTNTGRKTWLILLPGPPRELYPMFLQTVVPFLQREIPPTAPCACLTLRTTGMGESMVENKIAPLLQTLTREGLQIGYCARVGEVDVRLVATGKDAEKIVAHSEKVVRQQLGNLVFGVDTDTLEGVIVRLLTERKRTLALAESCTGGLISHRITNISGASAVLMSGLVTYSNQSKMNLLGVREETLSAHGAVSEQVAREMAEGARQRLETDYALSVTGIAGPTGGTNTKPVGTVFMALAQASGVTVQRQFNPFDRETFKFVTTQQALNLLRLSLEQLHTP